VDEVVQVVTDVVVLVVVEEAMIKVKVVNQERATSDGSSFLGAASFELANAETTRRLRRKKAIRMLIE
jgi:hypothetical protein